MRDICNESSSDLKPTLDAAYGDWRTQYKQVLQELALRWQLFVIHSSETDHTTLAETNLYMNEQFQALRSGVKKIYLQKGIEAFRSFCERYSSMLRTDFANPEKPKFAIAAERNEIAGRIKQLQPEVSNRQIAKTLGVNHDAELIAARQLFAIE
jgi:hypothetical protein